MTRSDLGELFIFGIADSRIDPRTERLLKNACPGSILLFRRNLVSNRQTVELTEQLRSLHRTCSTDSLFIGLDQEGGQVARVPFDPPMPSPWAIGVTKNPALAEELGFQVGTTLGKLGFNLNLAPVLDLGDPKLKSFIGSRSLGSDPQMVGQLGASLSMGMIRAHVLPVAKHFPGLGSVPNDPHQVMVRRPATAEGLWKRDLLPFKDFASIFPTGIMPSHLIYAQAQLSAVPGTFSRTLLQGWLRDRMSYRGLVISDDLLMRGAQTGQDLGENVVAALRAGVDLVMVSWSVKSQAQAVEAVRRAVKSGVLAESDLRERISRIRKAKRVIGEPKTDKNASDRLLLLAGSHRYTDIAYEILRKNLHPQMEGLPRERPQRVFLWPEDLRTKWQIERSLQVPTFACPSRGCEGRKGDLILAFARTKREARVLSSWSPALKKKTIVINQVEPGLFDASFGKQVQVFLEHPMLPAEVAKELQMKWGPPAPLPSGIR